MKEEKRDTLMIAAAGANEIAKFCTEMAFDLMRLSELVEEERSAKIIEGLGEKLEETIKCCIAITAVCKTITNGKSGVENVNKTIEKMLNELDEEE